MSYDPADYLVDPRGTAPEPEDWCANPGLIAECEFYAALRDWRKADPEALTTGPQCPVCKRNEPVHQLGCWMTAETEPSYKLTSADFNEPTGWNY